ncbi:MAG: glycosyltransferase [Melioribacteraceae bacterium]|nr:glycosyltransferase [Melioribacteraceae bacterium]MCF8354627.1 glycosyltransferase [Melioribacteraceae bacterium]MCF8395015.1 glycosyltransferase [Melioribacteraceae bacterium]MCF8418881.1 glycosyltransferase [Melioribacteraceae bacterium]
MKFCLAYLGNPFHDSRIINLSNSLKADGHQVKAIGFDFQHNAKRTESNGIISIPIDKSNPVFFFIKYFLFLVRELIKIRADVYIAEEVYSLPAVVVIGKIRKAKIYYNSRELYAYLGGLRNKKYSQKIIAALEKYLIYKVDLVLTTGSMDSEFLEKFYKIKNTLVIRNIPIAKSPSSIINFRKKFNLPADSILLIYQGMIMEGRGIELVLKTIADIPEIIFIIIGDGSHRKRIEAIIKENRLERRVVFTGMINQDELINYTAGGDIGLTLIENISISYYHALPNKLFEYINAGLPIISSNLPQMKDIVERYNVGKVVEYDQKELRKILKDLINNRVLLAEYSTNCKIAAKELNWNVEYSKAAERLINP